MSTDEKSLSPYAGLAKKIRPFGSASDDAREARPIDAPVRLSGPSSWSAKPRSAEEEVAVSSAARRRIWIRAMNSLLNAGVWTLLAVVCGLGAGFTAPIEALPLVFLTTAIVTAFIAIVSFTIGLIGVCLYVFDPHRRAPAADE